MRIVTKVAATAAVLGAVAVVAATPASAGTANCSLGYACAWENANFDGRRASFENGIPDMRYLATNFNDVASSLQNNGRTSNVVWYADIQYRGDSWLEPRGTVVTDLAGTYLQDRISSARFV